MLTTQKKKIGVIGLKGLPAFGGAATVGENIIKYLKDEYDFTVYSVSSHTVGSNSDGYRQIVFKKFWFKPLNTLVYFLKSVAHALFFGEYDLIHLHHGSSGYVLPLLKMKYKVLLTLHGVYRKNYVDVKFSFLTNILMKVSQNISVRYADKLVSCSLVDANYVYERYRENAEFISNGVDALADENVVKKEDYIVFSAGRIYQIKGLHLLLEAMHINKDQTKLLVVGSLDHVESYKKDMYKLAEGLNVTFVPLIKEKQKLFELIRNCKFFVFPSIVEAMAMMMLEVASINVPLVAGNLEANTAVFAEDQVLFFEANNAQSLAEKLEYAKMHPEEMREKASRAYENVKTNYNWRSIAYRYRKVYDEMLS